MERALRAVLSVAGSDPSGGAGLQSDLATFHAHGLRGWAVASFLTAQNELAVRAVHPLPADFVAAQLEALFERGLPAAIKTGLLGSGAVISAVAEVLAPLRPRALVVDPVFAATSGTEFADREAVLALGEHLLPLACLLTPNRSEAERLCGWPVDSLEAQERAGRELRQRGAGAVLVKGGHLEGREVCDVLVHAGGTRIFRAERIAGDAPERSVHGTGCALSAAIAARLARGEQLERAIEEARAFVRRGIEVALAGEAECAAFDHLAARRGLELD